MNLDVWCLVLVGTFALTGAFQGASGQVARIVALAGATLAGFLGGPAVGKLSPLNELPLAARETFGGLALGLLVYLLLSAGLRAAFRRVIDRNAWGRSDRTLGGLFGGAQGLYLAWVLVTCIPVVNLALAARGSRLRFRQEGSWAARFVARHPFVLAGAAPKEEAALKKTIDGFQKLKMPVQ